MCLAIFWSAKVVKSRFLVLHTEFTSLEQLNERTFDWVENNYNSQYHSGIQMKPLDSFNLDHSHIHFLCDDEYTEEVFFIEETRKVSKTNVFSINCQKYECPVDLRKKNIHVRFDRTKRDRFIVYFNGSRMGLALLLDLHYHANRRKSSGRTL
jgi:putative transposase